MSNRDSKYLKVALIGAGEMASVHALNIVANPFAELVYIVDPDQQNATNLASKTGAKVATEQQIFEDDSIDAYVVASPPFTHADYIEKAIAINKYVFCEKPIDNDLERIKTCMETIGEHTSKVQMGFNRRFDRDFAALKAALDDGKIGKAEQVLLISRDHSPPAPAMLKNSSGMFRETAIHDFDMARWLIGEEFVEVYVCANVLINQAYKELGHTDTSTTILKTACGQQVTIINSWRAVYGYDQRIEVLGSEGLLSVDNKSETRQVIANHCGIQHQNPFGGYMERYAEAYRTEIDLFLCHVAAQEPTTPNAWDGYCASLIANKAEVSASTNKPVKIDTP